jgi:hypothetical protein
MSQQPQDVASFLPPEASTPHLSYEQLCRLESGRASGDRDAANTRSGERLTPTALPAFCALLLIGQAEQRFVLFQRHGPTRLLRLPGLGQEFERACRFAALPDIRSVAHRLSG